MVVIEVIDNCKKKCKCKRVANRELKNIDESTNKKTSLYLCEK